MFSGGVSGISGPSSLLGPQVSCPFRVWSIQGMRYLGVRYTHPPGRDMEPEIPSPPITGMLSREFYVKIITFCKRQRSVTILVFQEYCKRLFFSQIFHEYQAPYGPKLRQTFLLKPRRSVTLQYILLDTCQSSPRYVTL